MVLYPAKLKISPRHVLLPPLQNTIDLYASTLKHWNNVCILCYTAHFLKTIFVCNHSRINLTGVNICSWVHVASIFPSRPRHTSSIEPRMPEPNQCSFTRIDLTPSTRLWVSVCQIVCYSVIQYNTTSSSISIN